MFCFALISGLCQFLSSDYFVFNMLFLFNFLIWDLSSFQTYTYGARYLPLRTASEASYKFVLNIQFSFEFFFAPQVIF